MRTGWALGCLYLAAYGAWAWFFRASVDPLARRALGRSIHVPVGWVRATTFPLEIWVWGLGGRSHDRDDFLLDSRVALGSVALCLAGAFLPTGALCLLLRWSPGLSNELGSALYLTTPLLILFFSASHLCWRDSEPASIRGKRVKIDASGEQRPGSQPPLPGSTPAAKS